MTRYLQGGIIQLPFITINTQHEKGILRNFEQVIFSENVKI